MYKIIEAGHFMTKMYGIKNIKTGKIIKKTSEFWQAEKWLREMEIE